VDWTPLGGTNPAPGSPEDVRNLAHLLRGVQRDADAAADRLRVIKNQAGQGIWTGLAANAFRENLATILPDLERLAESHGLASSVLFDFAVKLDYAQGLARDALYAARIATDRCHNADQEIAEARGSVQSRFHRLQQAEQDLHRVQSDQLHATAAGDLAAHMQYMHEVDLKRSLRRSAATALEEARHRQALAEQAKVIAAKHLEEAQRLAKMAAGLHTDASQYVARRLRDAADVHLQDKPWYEKFADTVVDTVKRVAANPIFTQLADALEELGTLMMVVGVVAAIIAAVIFTPAVGLLVLGAMSTAAGAVSFAGTAIGFAVGKRSLGQLAWAGIGILPGGKHIHEWGGLIKRSINFKDARRVTGFFRQFHVAERVEPSGLAKALKIDPQTYFRIDTARGIGVEGLKIGHETVEIFSEEDSPVELTKDIHASLTNLDQFDEAQNLFEDMGIERPLGDKR
jgi:hypothetical protein